MDDARKKRLKELSGKSRVGSEIDEYNGLSKEFPETAKELDDARAKDDQAKAGQPGRTQSGQPGQPEQNR